MSSRPAILIADDDPDFRNLVRTILERAGFGTVETSTGEEALASAAASEPQLVILDVHLPQMSGYEVCQELRDRWGDELPIIFVSGVRGESYDRVSGLLLGADDYLAKPFDPDELLARIRALLRRAAPNREADPPIHNSKLDALTSRERQVLRMLAAGATQEDIANALVISSRTVGTHIQNTLAKLGVHSRAQAVALAHLLGLPATDS
jgi:DNA-binding response OmpR family regulator